MSSRRPFAARKTARPPTNYPNERQSHRKPVDDASDQDTLHSVRPARKTATVAKVAGTNRANRAHKSAVKEPHFAIAHTTPAVTQRARKQGISGKAAIKSPTPQYDIDDDSSVYDDSTPSEKSGSGLSMSQPSSEDEDIVTTRTHMMDIKKGSLMPGPSPHPEELLEELLAEARSLNMSTDEKPPIHGAYWANCFGSEYNPTTDGPSDASIKPKGGRVYGWRCPLRGADGSAYEGCVLYETVFPNVGILGLHMSRHHPHLEVHWRHTQAGHDAKMYVYPRSGEPEIECITTYYDPNTMGNPALRIIPKTEPEPEVSLSPTPDMMQTDSDTMHTESVPPSTITPPPAFVALPTPLPPTPIKREPSPSTDSDIVELLALPEPPAPRPEIKRDRSGIPLDPYIQPPYLATPVPTEDGGFIYYSCRPGGAKLYDYLQVLSLKPYGLMRWQVEETEAHILESEDLSDVGKCMHSLHNRWVLLHEVEMYVNPAKCIANFVHTWWYHIYNMVGVKVLTHYLTEFNHLKYITVQQAGDICHQYRIDVKAGTAEDGSLRLTNSENGGMQA